MGGSDAADSKAAASAISRAKKLQQQQDEATTQEPVLLASVRQPMRGARVHALPCSIVHDGPAAVSTFFLPKRVGGGGGQGKEGGQMEVDQGEDEDGATYEAQFRGRNLKGVKAAVPEGMVGFVAREAVLPPELADAAPSAAANRYWALDSEFTGTVLWRHDLPPPLEHCLQLAQEWCTLAKAIHVDDGGEEQQAPAQQATAE